MRRAFSALLTGGLLLAASACGTAPNGSGPNTPAGTAASANVTPAVGAACEALSQAYTKNMAPYAQALTAVATDPKAVAEAQQALAAFATAVKEATAISADQQLQAAGKEAAEQMRKKSADTKYFGTIKTPDDVSKAMGPTLSAWLAPVQRHCS
ncbi:hypothetical protein AB0G04_19180 [Actinoplanes sp. NPDC023801]|uniref:hypothetical protein n=1 Tax=Actinoplanes sp. NPDC023801 TaxID=3154595 RepID=UPI0033D6A27E